MNILWLTNTPSNASTEFGYSHQGGGWISSLENLIKDSVNLGIAFFYKGPDLKKIIKDNVTYFGIPYKSRGKLGNLLSLHLGTLNDEQDNNFAEIIEDFKPDILHIFGTESGYGKVLLNKFPKEKVVFHLQGLVEPYSQVYYPLNFNPKKNNSVKSIIKAQTFWHAYKLFKKRAYRETQIIANWKYFMGRTDWDKQYVKVLNSEVKYFHCDEVLRDEFYSNGWLPQALNNNGKLIVATTINPSIYKGLDLIYKVMHLFKDRDIEWRIFGLKENNSLNQLIKKEYGFDIDNRIKFFGQVNAVELITQLKQSHFFIHPSYIDNSPNSVCEAMMLGMPVLSSSVGGIKSLIIHNETGFLFNPYDFYDLAGLLNELVNNYTQALLVAKNGREAAVKRHDRNAIKNNLIEIYAKIYN